MNQNKRNNKKALDLVGPCRPHDILKMDPKGITIRETGPGEAQILFNKTYYKCGRNHIFVNENFDEYDSFMKFTKVIRPNSNIHIFLNDRGCDTMGLFAFCQKIAHMNGCAKKNGIKVIIYLSYKSCSAARYIMNYFGKIVDIDAIKPILVSTTINHGIDFWCTNWYDFDRKRDGFITDGERYLRVIAGKQNCVNGIRIKLSKWHGIETNPKSFEVYGISSNFMPGEFHSESDTFILSNKPS